MLFNGVYYESGRGASFGYFRFFEDGTALYCKSAQTPQQMYPRLTKDDDTIGRGKYQLDGNKITITCECSGKFPFHIDCLGIISEEKMIIEMKSTGYADRHPEKEYLFYKA